MNDKWIQRGFIAAGLANILGVLTFSKLFTNPVIPKADPFVMSNFGMLVIILWGLAYIAISKNYQQVKWLVGVFALEKLVYITNWVMWHKDHDVAAIMKDDTLAWAFFNIYGINDLIFFAFFVWVFFIKKHR